MRRCPSWERTVGTKCRADHRPGACYRCWHPCRQRTRGERCTECWYSLAVSPFSDIRQDVAEYHHTPTDVLDLLASDQFRPVADAARRNLNYRQLVL